MVEFNKIKEVIIYIVPEEGKIGCVIPGGLNDLEKKLFSNGAKEVEVDGLTYKKTKDFAYLSSGDEITRVFHYRKKWDIKKLIGID